MSRKTLTRILSRGLFYVIIFVIAFYALFPFYWAFSTSLKEENEMFSRASYVPREPSLVNYEAAFDNDNFLRSFLNSAFVSGSTAALAIVIGSFAAYALGRLQFRGRTVMLYAVLAMTMFPRISILSGLYRIVRDLDIYGTQFALIFSYPVFTLPFAVWVLTSFFRGLPREIEEAALVDGATTLQTFRLILLPLTAPALVTTGLLAFITSWNEYLYALNFTVTNADAQTVPVVIAQFTGEIARQEPIAEIMAAAMVVTLPLVLLVLIFQNRIVAGLTAGAVKG